MRRTAGTRRPPTAIRSSGDWLRLVGGLVAVFVLFHWSAVVLGSDRGQAGVIVGAIVTGAILAVERWWFASTLLGAARALGFGVPGWTGPLSSAVISSVLVLMVPLYVWTTGSQWTMEVDWWRRLPGLAAQAGIAEEALFRGYLFGHLRRGRSFWHAAALSMLPFVAVHLLMFLTMPWPVALASLLLAVVISFPMAHLYEVGHATVWAPAILHFVVQGVVKSIHLDGDSAASFALIWMTACAVIPLLALVVPRPVAPVPLADHTGREPAMGGSTWSAIKPDAMNGRN
jgi:membrane protease YdiL (CAAX protease family)